MLNVNYISTKLEKLWYCQEPSGMAMSLQRMEVAWTPKKPAPQICVEVMVDPDFIRRK